MCPFQFPTVCARWVKTAPCYDATVRDKWHGFHLNVLGVSENKDYVAIFCTVNCANYLDLTYYIQNVNFKCHYNCAKYESPIIAVMKK